MSALLFLIIFPFLDLIQSILAGYPDRTVPKNVNLSAHENYTHLQFCFHYRQNLRYKTECVWIDKEHFVFHSLNEKSNNKNGNRKNENKKRNANKNENRNIDTENYSNSNYTLTLDTAFIYQRFFYTTLQYPDIEKGCERLILQVTLDMFRISKGKYEIEFKPQVPDVTVYFFMWMTDYDIEMYWDIYRKRYFYFVNIVEPSANLHVLSTDGNNLINPVELIRAKQSKLKSK